MHDNLDNSVRSGGAWPERLLLLDSIVTSNWLSTNRIGGCVSKSRQMSEIKCFAKSEKLSGHGQFFRLNDKSVLF